MQSLISVEALQHDVRDGRTIALWFTARWCRSCQSEKPTMESLAQGATGMVHYYVDVDELGDVAAHYRVTSVPSLVVLDGRTHRGTVVGGGARAWRNLLARR